MAKITVIVESDELGTVGAGGGETFERTIGENSLIRLLDGLSVIHANQNGNSANRTATIRRWARSWIRGTKDAVIVHEHRAAAKAARDAISDIDTGE